MPPNNPLSLNNLGDPSKESLFGPPSQFSGMAFPGSFSDLSSLNPEFQAPQSLFSSRDISSSLNDLPLFASLEPTPPISGSNHYNTFHQSFQGQPKSNLPTAHSFTLPTPPSLSTGGHAKSTVSSNTHHQPKRILPLGPTELEDDNYRLNFL